MTSDFPMSGMELTHILVVSDLDRAKSFYQDVLGASLYGEYGGTSIVFNSQGHEDNVIFTDAIAMSDGIGRTNRITLIQPY